MAVSARAPAQKSAPNEVPRLAELLDDAEHEPHFSISHRINLPAPAGAAWEATDSLCLGDLWPIRLLFLLRGLRRPGTTREAMNSLGFGTQREVFGRELSFVGAGRLWNRRRLFDPLTDDELTARADHPAPRRSIAIWSAYRFEPLGPDHTHLTQATGVSCASRFAWLLFGAYWIATRPFLDLIRVVLLRAVRNRLRQLPSNR